MSVKTKEGTSETRLKQPQNEPQLSVEMSALKAEYELCNELRVLAGATIVEYGGSESARKRVIQSAAGNYKNRGNEAKEYLKTKDITFMNGTNLVRFTRKLARI